MQNSKSMLMQYLNNFQCALILYASQKNSNLTTYDYCIEEISSMPKEAHETSSFVISMCSMRITERRVFENNF